MKGMTLANVSEHWRREESKMWQDDLVSQETVSMSEACFEGECLADFAEKQRGQVAALGRYLRLVLWNGGWPPELLPCGKFRAGTHIVYTWHLKTF